MKVKIDKNIFNVKILTDKKSQSLGMMNKSSFEEFGHGLNGLLFMMDTNHQCFWMKNCLIELDIIIIEDNTISKIHHNCKPCHDDYCPSYCGRGNLVLEIVGGSCREKNIKEGDSLEYI